MTEPWPKRWRARWIRFEPLPEGDLWYGRRRRPPDAFGYLRTTISLEGAPARARCRVTADGRYVLFVNGSEVGRGPVRSEPAHLTYDDYDIAPLMRPGENVIAALVRHYGGPTLYWKPAKPVGDLGYGSFLFEAEIDDRVVGTDASWRAMRAPYDQPDLNFVEGPPPMESLDARSVPIGWAEPGFDDAGWEHAVALAPAGLGLAGAAPPTEPFAILGPRPIPHPAERAVEPSRWLTRTTADFGKIVSGHPVVEVDADVGTVLELTCGEDVDATGAPIAAPRGWSMRYIAAGAPGERMEAFEPVGFRYLSYAARGGEVRSVRIRVRERTYPNTGIASFSSSDPLLDEIWRAGARSVELCSDDAFIDCPGRERRAWLGDGYVVTRVHLVCNGDPALPVWNLRLHAQGARADGLLPMVAAADMSDRPETIPDYSLVWCTTLAAVVEHTGDRALAAELLPTALRALEWFERHRGSDGLLADVPGWVFVDWAQLERRPQMAALDAMHVMALDAVAWLADQTGDDGTAARMRARAERTRAAFERYWDDARGVYVDAADPGGDAGRRVSQQTNAIAIVAGCAPRERWGRMLDHVTDDARLVRTATPGDPGTLGERLNRQWESPANFDDERDVVLAQPHFAHHLHDALVRAGRREALLPSIRRWAGMLARGNGCFEEYWDAEPGLGSRCHAWSATPTYDLSTHILGVRSGGLGWDPIVVEPFLDVLEHAEGTVPTPHGPVHVRIARDADPEVRLPRGARGVLRWQGREIPLGENPSIG